MLGFYESSIGFDDPSPTQKRLGGIGMDAVRDLDHLKITNSHNFNRLHFFEDQFFDSQNVKDRLELAINIYAMAKQTPGYINPGVETYINILKAAAEKGTGIQTICD